MIDARLKAKGFALPLSLVLPIAFALGLGAAACGDAGESDCTVGSFACACFPGNLCLSGLTCLSGICVQFGGGEEETGPGDGDPGDGDPSGDGDPGDGDPSGDGDPGDGDPGDGDPGDGDGDAGDGDPGDGDPGGPCNAGAEVLLYSQGVASDSDSGILVGTFTDYDASSIELADDFTVPQGQSCWCITQVVARGFYTEAIEPANTPNFFVEIYNDGNSVPTGAPIVSEQGLVFADDAGEYTVTLDMEAVVPAGAHWLSFRPELDSTEARWYWRLMTMTPGDQAAARDQDEIVFGGLCTVWTPASACYDFVPNEGYEFSMQFDIFGVVGGADCN